jgi:hypothetical protein
MHNKFTFLKISIMKNIFIILLFLVSASTAFAQPPNNAIFAGGSGDGFDKATFAQAGNNIYAGGTGQGWSKTTYLQASNNIYAGGTGQGWSKTTYLQASTNIYAGGVGQGYSSTAMPLKALPVELVYFNVRKQDNLSALLTWKTAQEINAAYYEVERSTDGFNFTVLSKVKASGNSSNQLTYSFIDNAPLNGVNYYRLKQVDNDGKYVESPARAVQFQVLDNVAIQYYPNPTNGILNIKLTDVVAKEAKLITIFNTTGIIVGQYKVQANSNKTIAVDMGTYAKGLYIIQLKSLTANSTNRIILQ